ncbi:hypothetical protein A6R68_02665 [Neotoma lepida]|uniref:Uncharacterized protein n=1 Tax=Neotoma lepida TaxID=56216 RepID=A0A1A6GSD2_NEOLE|nr:hypothetical protein A6R68_02665 [Neotoma lepida]
MESQGCSHDITWLPCLGVKEDQEEQHGQYRYQIGIFVFSGKQMCLRRNVKAEIFQAGEGRAEKGAWGQPGMGAVGTDSEREDLNGGREDHFGPAAPGPVGDGNKNGGTSGSGLEQEQKEPVAEGTESQKSVFKGSSGTEKLMVAKLLCFALSLPNVLSMAF